MDQTSKITDRLRRLSGSTLLLIAIIALAAILRIWGTGFGLPYLLHNDEGFEVIRALQLGSGSFDFDRISKGGYFYLLFVEFGLLFVVLLAAGVVNSTNDFALLFVSDPTLFYLTGRVTTAILGSLTVYLVFRIAKQAYGVRAALLAAIFLAVNILHVRLSHFVTVDVPMVMLVTLALWFALRIADRGRQKDYYLAALTAALAVATKLPAIIVLLPLVIAHVAGHVTRGMPVRSALAVRHFWLAVGLFVIAYLVLAPGIVVNFGVFTASLMAKFSSGGGNGQELASASAASNDGINLVGFYLSRIATSMGWPIAILTIGGLYLAVVRRTISDVLLLVFSVVFFVAISATSDPHYFFPRYILPVLPPALILAGRFADELLDRLPASGGTPLTIALTVAICALPFATSVADNYRLTQPDTRVLAKAWIDQEIPAGSTVLIEGSRTRPFNGTVPLKNSAENIRARIAGYKDTDPGRARYLRLELQSLSGSTYDLVLVDNSGVEDLDTYRSAGVRYFVVRPGARASFRQQRGWPEFIRELRADSDVELIKRFEPDDRTRPGPVIEVYRAR